MTSPREAGTVANCDHPIPPGIDGTRSLVTSSPLPNDPNGTPANGRRRPAPDSFPHPAAEYRAEITEYDDSPDECTVYPADAEEWELMTRWITAREGSYVDLEEMR
ncbi:hypothetical protein SAMN04487948_12223 [Halogranum amylolyticum]|uniref:DUF7511 domain-containing protein n=1 Tax=Halogranum amylolyticum TaxID=660520 RepID=A0A1H8W1P7_9EURY|nr:hypothetical protein [Halogranum amylolyticum]SEP21566.1 hypothetical protein SAMN04487948_12223 [Halogranum amylolyticum]